MAGSTECGLGTVSAPRADESLSGAVSAESLEREMMEYRRLGRTGLQVSVLGLGGGYLSVVERELGERIYQRAFELGINYFDGRYGDSNVKLRPVLREHRAECVVATKTRETGASGVLRRVDEELQELDTDYVDVFLLRTYSHEMLQDHLAPEGAFEGALRARDEGTVHWIGMAAHGDLSVLVAGIETGLVDVVIFPMNIVRREALEMLIPVAQRHDVGLVVMKPVSVGMIPAQIALPWLMNQPIHTMVPGACSVEQVEIDVAAVERNPVALSPAEEEEVERWRRKLDHETCRICDENCGSACEAKLPISHLIHHDVWYNHYRNMGLDAFMRYPWSPGARKRLEEHFTRRLEMLQACTRCGECETLCPHGLPILRMFDAMLHDHPPLIAALHEAGWAAEDVPDEYL